MSDAVVKAVGPEDASALAEVLGEHSRRARGEEGASEAEVREWFRIPSLWIRASERDGTLTGYLDVFREDAEHAAFDLRALDEESAEALLTAAEQHTRDGHRAPQTVHAAAQGADELARALFERRGWALVRHSLTMEIDLGRELAGPEWPDGLAVRAATAEDAERLYEAHMDGFADHWNFHRIPYEDWRGFGAERDDFDPSLWWVAEAGDEVAGLSLTSWHPNGDPRFGWIAVLTVRPPWRGRGLGTALLRQSFRAFAERGARRVGPSVDAENTTGAVGLYERAGMRAVRRSDVFEKVL